jgi:hypothetical protein
MAAVEMKWFQLDSDTPDDPKIRTVKKQCGLAGFGALVNLWCFVAKHGRRRPGWSLDTTGRPIDKSFLVDASELSVDEFDLLLSVLARNGHISAPQWKNRRVLVFPAMSRRVDDYTRKRLRSNSGHTPDNVRQQDNTVHNNSNKNPHTPLKGGSRSGVIRADRTRAAAFLKNNFGRCPHDPRCGSSTACRARLAAAFADERIDAERHALKAGRR